MSEPARISVQDVRTRMQSGASTMLVCSYKEDEKFQAYQLEGATAYSQFESHLSSFGKDHDLVFYCA